MKYLKATLLGSGALASLLLSSVLTGCQDEDFGYTSEEIRDSVYDRNFIAHFGEIDPEQSWDLSKYAVSSDGTFSTRAISPTNCDFNQNADYFSDYVRENQEWYYVEREILEKIEEKLPEGVNNTSLGKPFQFITNGAFYIIPIFQGQSGLDCDLHMVVGEKDICIWKRSEGIEKQDIGSFDWKELHNDRFKDYKRDGHTYSNNIDYYQDYSVGDYKASTIESKGIRSHPIRCNLPLGTNVRFYLHITQGHLNYASQNGWEFDRVVSYNSQFSEANLAFTGTKQWSDGGKMLEITSNEFLPTNVSQYGSNAMIIACEDAMSGTETDNYYTVSNGTLVPHTYSTGSDYTGYDNATHKINSWGGDNDINDLVFLIVAESLPAPIYPSEIRKRYIIEDMGSVVDWDFNDIVVDVIETHDTETNEILGQRVELKHQCGTTPFDIIIGDDERGYNNNVFGTRQGIVQDKNVEITDVNVDLTKTNKGQWPWNHETNNIKVKVYQRAIYDNLVKDKNDHIDLGESGVNLDEFTPLTIEFPEQGKVPRIIAVDTDFEWTEEHENIKRELWQKYHIQVNTNIAEAGTISGDGYYKHNKEVTLTAMTNANYRFTGWSTGETSSTIRFNATENKTIIANFELLAEKIVLYSTTDNIGDAYDGNFVCGTLNNPTIWDRIKTALKPENGYNTITVKGSSNYGIRYNTNAWPKLLYTDADHYYTETVVLTAEQIAKITAAESTGFVVQSFDGTITEVSLSRTPDYYTVSLSKDGPGTVSTTDRSAYSVASYAEGTVVTYTAKTTQKGYYVKWIDSSSDNYDLGTEESVDGNDIVTNTRTIQANADLTVMFVKPKLTVGKEISSDQISFSAAYTSGDNTTIFTSQSSSTVDVDAHRKFNVSAAYSGSVNSNRYRICWGDDANEHATERSFTLPNYDLNLKAYIEYLVKAVVKNQEGAVQNDLTMGSVNFREYKESQPWTATPYPDEFWAVSGTKLSLYAKPAPGFKFVKWNDGTTKVTRTMDINGANDAYVFYRPVQDSEITELWSYGAGWGLQNWDFNQFDPNGGNYNSSAFDQFTQKVSENSRMLIFEFDQIPDGANFSMKTGSGQGWALKNSNVTIVGNKLYYELDYYDWENAKAKGFIFTPTNLSTKINLKKVSIY